MYFINAYSTISHQLSFQNKGWINTLQPLSANSELITPHYKKFIEASSLRRMSKIIRMSLACAKDCIAQSTNKNIDAIIVGTGLGCLTDTEKFLKNILTIKGLIPPTSFIQSTHNSIAGQISLTLKNHNYNITHTQNSLSFEYALQDAMLCIDEGCTTILIGAVDEKIALLEVLAAKLNLNTIVQKLTSGASFFILSNTQNKSSKACLLDSLTIGLNKTDAKEIIHSFLNKNNLNINDIDLVLLNTNGSLKNKTITQKFPETNVLSYEKYCGYYFTNSAFGMHLASEILNQHSSKILKNNKPIKRILLYNNFNNKNIGLTLLQSLEA